MYLDTIHAILQYNYIILVFQKHRTKVHFFTKIPPYDILLYHRGAFFYRPFLPGMFIISENFNIFYLRFQLNL